ncbi:hypothetical protein GLOIN_2v1845549 [Rhizophagus irregularis DAOM 181602=DAOM 197198]|uniref:Uncharacterized protein n=1 Tax=Rhizophagus irregularis (strain DAOM 181602 / DAOM 197198 / MUCL 43194) TaxID=747089 RepID=A0A2P4PFF7_RHIID|nr:hypothetical protein GLOIN_2v1845549 [Rhizophagus irregularis DAOM 181602=DAOM 197198]POG64090.1 hypothetical protein GLOIN_2v1845549 [Rhizophagus irregularis DAOM 181602=DAOM 197198]|eukprot:XP_025170956.1 hypothetical protein GLOIN_2v1845549 [Rhizophagus irregularis DAOM 181602=DAOM 197198]
MFIPHKYRNIIPKDPIYDEKSSFIVPGSWEWFTFMYKMEIQMAIKVAEERHLRLIQEEQIAREEHKARAQKLARDEAGILPARRYAHKDRTTDENSASTSEDTKDLECRPLKRDVIWYCYLLIFNVVLLAIK